jgi:hypothetical protein
MAYTKAANITHHAQEPSTPRFNPQLPIIHMIFTKRSEMLRTSTRRPIYSAHTRKLLLSSQRAVCLQNASEHMCHRADEAATYPSQEMHLPVRLAADDASRDAPEPDSH